MRAIALFFLTISSFCIADDSHQIPACDCFAKMAMHDAFVREVVKINSYGCTSLDHPAPYQYSDSYFLARFSKSMLLQSYLENLNYLSSCIEEKKEHCIDLATYMAENQVSLVFERKLDSILYGGNGAQAAIEKLREQSVEFFRALLQKCPHKESGNLAYTINAITLSIYDRDYEEALKKIKVYFDWCVASRRTDLLTRDMYAMKGLVCFELGLFDSAITALTKALRKDPGNQAVCAIRAKAYFETGRFDLAIQDYRKVAYFENHFPNASQAFEIGLFEGIAIQRFEPSLCYSAKGLDRPLWAHIAQDLTTAREFIEACYAVKSAFLAYVETLSDAELREICGELRELYYGADRLDEQAQGRLIGKAISRFGVTIFFGAKELARVSEQLQQVNARCNLELLSRSSSEKEKLLALVNLHVEERTSCLRHHERGIRFVRREQLSGVNSYQELHEGCNLEWEIVTYGSNRTSTLPTYPRTRLH